MLAAQRIQSILKDIKSDHIRTVAELSRKYEVSEMTVRRDLKQLEDQGLVTRTHGGAVPNKLLSGELQFVQKQGLHETEKSLIARFAVARFVDDNDIISMEGGTTVAGMVQHMGACRNVTVMTNGLHTLFELQRIASSNSIISTGGILRDVSNTLVGPVAEGHFREFNASRVFISATGWTAGSGFTDPNMLEIHVKKAMVNSAREVIMLLDSSKFGTVSLTRILDTSSVDVIVADKNIPREIYDRLSREGIDIHIAE